MERRLVEQEAAVFGRAYAYAHWQSLAGEGDEDVANTYSWIARPPERSLQLTAWLHAGFVMPATQLDYEPHSTPLSMSGPGCSGNVLANARVSACVYHKVLAYRAGWRYEYNTPPHDARPYGSGCEYVSPPADAAGTQYDSGCGHGRRTERDARSLAAAQAAEWGRGGRCAACTRDAVDAPDDMYHYLIECPHTAAERRTLELTARRAVEGILCDAAKLAGHVPDAEMCRMLIDSGRELLHARRMNCCSAGGKAMFFHLAMAQPWSVVQVPIEARIGTDGRGTLPAVLGLLFDLLNVPPERARSLCTRWARAAAQMVDLCVAARELTRAPSLPWGELPVPAR
jgi:hypothetical protein